MGKKTASNIKTQKSIRILMDHTHYEALGRLVMPTRIYMAIDEMGFELKHLKGSWWEHLLSHKTIFQDVSVLIMGGMDCKGKLSSEEIKNVTQFVEQGGGLFLVAPLPYGNMTDLNHLSENFGLQFMKWKAIDKEHHEGKHGDHVLFSNFVIHPVTTDIQTVSFGKSGGVTLKVSGNKARILLTTDDDAIPPNSPTLAVVPYGNGIVAAFTCCTTFADEYIEKYDNLKLFTNILRYLAKADLKKVELPKPKPLSKQPLGERRSLEVVSLDDMDGFEFQRFVAYLFARLGFGRIEEIRQVRDAGKDVIIRSPDGDLVIIECKHQPDGTISRPVIQKLHSAVITTQAKKGFVVTTGRFSVAATRYAEELESLIELVDLRVLCDIARRAQIKLVKKGESVTIHYVRAPSEELIKENVIAHIIGNAFSYPDNSSQLAKVTVVNTNFVPVYLLEYSLHEDFSTTVGVIHSVHVDRGQILINGQDGGLIKPQLTRILTPPSMTEEPPEMLVNVSSGKFKIGHSSAKRIGIEHIRKLHAKNVSYYGKNNVLYIRRCVPRISSVFVPTFMQVYLPFMTISCKILRREHRLSLCGNQSEVDILGSDAGICEICGERLERERLLCNSCGRVVHAPGFAGHSYFCEICHKTICGECAYWTRKYLFFKRKLCESCAQYLFRGGKKIRKLVTHDARTLVSPTLYQTLLNGYTTYYGAGTGKQRLEKKISTYMEQGLSREEAIRRVAEAEGY